MRMSWMRHVVVVLLAVVALASAVARADIPPTTLIPAYERVVLPNGLTLLLLEQHEIPLVHFDVVVRAGAMTDPAGKEGLADLTFSLLRKGTQRYSGEQLADELDFLGATLDGGVGHESAELQAEFLAKDVDAGLELLAEVLLRPTFPQAEVSKLVDLNVNGIREMKDNPRTVIGRYYDGFLFGSHPYGRPVDGTEASIAGLRVQDVKRFHADFVRPGATILSIAGDFVAADMRRKIEATFGAWKAAPVTAPTAPAPSPSKGKRVLLVDKPDATQTYFRIGNLGIERGNADEPSLEVVNTIFGGRFTSWLSTELRIKSGLSYNAHSAFVRRRRTPVPSGTAMLMPSFFRPLGLAPYSEMILPLTGHRMPPIAGRTSSAAGCCGTVFTTGTSSSSWGFLKARFCGVSSFSTSSSLETICSDSSSAGTFATIAFRVPDGMRSCWPTFRDWSWGSPLKSAMA